MFNLHDLLAFVLAASLVIVIPGPATLFVGGKLRHSVQAAAAAVAGIVAGDVLLITLSCAGFAMLIQAWPWLLPGMRVVGAVYLIYLGAGLLKSGVKAEKTAQVGVSDAEVLASTAAPDTIASFVRGLLITVSNPKPVLFFSSFFPLFLPAMQAGQSASSAAFLTLGLLFEVINIVYFSLLICLITRLQKNARLQKIPARMLQHISGCGLILCGVVMAVSAR